MVSSVLNNSAMGMNAMSSAMGTISQNISNINTTGYKAELAQFATVMSGQLNKYNNGSGNSPTGTMNFGVQSYTQNLNTVVGNMQSTSTFSDIAINGQGFFMVAQPSASGGVPTVSGTPSLFTRAGAFDTLAGSANSQNSPTYLVDGSGNYLLGWQGSNGTVTPGGAVTPISIPAATSVTRNGQTTLVDMVASPTTTETVLGNVSPDNRSSTTDVETLPLTAIDGVSGSHPFTLQFSPITTSQVTTTSTDTSTTPPTVTGPTTTSQVNPLNPDVWNLTFGSSETGATITSVPTTTTSTNTSTSGTVTTDTSTATTQGTTVTFNADGSIASPKTVTFSATWANGQTSNITVDISGLTQFGGSGKSNLASVSQNGYQDGQLQSLAFDSNGVLKGSYTNGQIQNLAQVAVARFPSADTLDPVSGTVFKETQNSGAPQIDTANKLGTSIEGATLESSTVDLGTEMGNMILAQKAYSMSSEVMKTADQMTTTAIGLTSESF